MRPPFHFRLKKQASRAPLPDWLANKGELADLVRAKGWSKTWLGPRESWPQSLRTAVCLVLESRLAMALAWGTDRLLFYNDLFRKIAGDKHPAALGQPLSAALPELWNTFEPICSAVVRRGESFTFEDKLFPIRRGHGLEDAYFTTVYSPVRIEDGSVGGTLVTLYETTSRVLQEATLRRARAMLVEGERIAHIGSFEYEAKTQTTVWSEGEFLIYGLDPKGPSPSYEELLRRCLPPDDAARLQEVFTQALQNGSVFELTHRIARPDGEVRSVHDRAQPHFDEGGQLLRYIGATLDVTQARQSEEALRQSEERYRLIVENAEEGIWTIDDQARTTFVNKRMADMLGYAVDEMNGRSLFDFMAESERTRAAELFERRRSGVLERHALTFSSKNGKDVRTEVGASPLIDSDGRILGAVALIVDLSQRARIQDMVEADQRKNEFIAVLSHELRNPLAPIRSGLYVLERAPAGSEAARRAQKIIERQVAHMAHLVDDLLDVSRIARGRIELRMEPVDLVETCRRVVEDHRTSFAQRGVTLKLVAGATPLPVLGDETRLSQVIANLLNNSLKFTPRGGKTIVSIEASDNQAIIQVADTGRDISKDLMSHLFDPFTQADMSLDRSLGGLGLGLVLVKGLIEMHKGTVTAESAGPGQGATFTLSLPLRASLPAPASAPLSNAHTASKRVLVIEDNIDSAQVLGDALNLLGHTVAIAHDGPEGLAEARTFRPDVVICDIGLPGMNGYAVAQALRADPSLSLARLIAHSGYASREHLVRVKKAGFDAQLAKPVDIGALQAAITSDTLPSEEND